MSIKNVDKKKEREREEEVEEEEEEESCLNIRPITSTINIIIYIRLPSDTINQCIHYLWHKKSHI